MEKQNKGEICQNNFTARQIYNIKERNYDWQSFKYVLPRKYIRNSQSNVRSGSLFCTKSNYLDALQKAKKKIPGPDYYKFSTGSLRPTSGKMDKGERKTISEQVKCKSQKQNHPGPGSYFKRPKSALTTMGSDSGSSIKNKQPVADKKHYLNEVQYLAAVLPGVGAYNLTSPKHITGPKLFKKAYVNSSKKGKQNQLNQNMFNTTECVTGTFEWMRSQSKKKNSNFFGKSKRFVTDSKYQKKPGPNIYKLDNEWSSKTNLVNVTCSSNSNLKTVYYH